MENKRRRLEKLEAINAYWTPERKAKAVPRTRPLPPGLVGPKAPAPAPSLPPKTTPPAEPKPASGMVQAGAIEPVYPESILYPWRTVGKLFFRSADGIDYTGSASVIEADGLLTAAHNLFDPKYGWSDHLLFVPAYADGKEPFGSWACEHYWVSEEWRKTDREAYDVGLIKLEKGGLAGGSIGEQTGVLRVKADLAHDRTWTAAGYPGRHAHGERLVAVCGAYVGMRQDGLVIVKEGKMGEGASGGPWLLNIDDTEASVNGVQSMGDELNSHSSYFRQWTMDFIREHLAVEIQD